MKITRETDYAVRCVLHLSAAPKKVAVMGEISGARQVPRPFLAKILQRLTKAGIVRSYRGLRGGFQLTRQPAEITLREVVEAIEGPVALNLCVEEGGECPLSGGCAVHPVWVKVSAGLAESLDRYDFARLARGEQKRGAGRTQESIGAAEDRQGAAATEEARHV